MLSVKPITEMQIVTSHCRRVDVKSGPNPRQGPSSAIKSDQRRYKPIEILPKSSLTSSKSMRIFSVPVRLSPLDKVKSFIDWIEDKRLLVVR